jgi:hypothetical protein
VRLTGLPKRERKPLNRVGTVVVPVSDQDRANTLMVVEAR